jgi:hypothetical protein
LVFLCICKTGFIDRIHHDQIILVKPPGYWKIEFPVKL